VQGDRGKKADLSEPAAAAIRLHRWEWQMPTRGLRQAPAHAALRTARRIFFGPAIMNLDAARRARKFRRTESCLGARWRDRRHRAIRSVCLAQGLAGHRTWSRDGGRGRLAAGWAFFGRCCKFCGRACASSAPSAGGQLVAVASTKAQGASSKTVGPQLPYALHPLHGEKTLGLLCRRGDGLGSIWESRRAEVQ